MLKHQYFCFTNRLSKQNPSVPAELFRFLLLVIRQQMPLARHEPLPVLALAQNTHTVDSHLRKDAVD